MSRLRDDRGSIVPIIPLVIIALLMLGALVVDGGRTLNERSQAQSYAEEAARAGATAVQLSSPRLAVDPALAQSRVDSFCANVMSESRDTVIQCKYLGVSATTVTCNGKPVVENIIVRARVRMRIEPTLLGMLGVQHLYATGDAKARPYEGITTAGSC